MTVRVFHRKQQSISTAVVVLISPVNGGAACRRRVWELGPVARYRLQMSGDCNHAVVERVVFIG